MIYLNYAAMCPTLPEAEDDVVTTLTKFKEYLYSEAGGQWYHTKVQRYRESVAQLLSVSKPGSVAFVPNASTAHYLILSSIDWNPGDIIVSSTHENPSIVNELLALKRRGVEIRFLPLTSSPQQFLTSIHHAAQEQKIRAIMLSHVSHVDGRVFPIAEIGAVSKEHEILFIVDGAQAVGHIDVNVDNVDCDAYFFSGYKWCGGPMGTGGLVITERFLAKVPSVLSKPIPAGQHPSTRFEIGTYNIGLFAGLAKACEITYEEGLAINQRLKIREMVKPQVEQMSKVQLKGWDGPHAPGILTFQILDSQYHDLLMKIFKKENIVVKHFTEYPKGETPLIRMSWMGLSDQQHVSFAIEQSTKL